MFKDNSRQKFELMLFSRHSTWSKKSAVINPNKAPWRWLPFEELLQCFYASYPILVIDKSRRFLLWIEVKSLALIHWFFRVNFLDSAVVYGVEVLRIYSGYVKLDLFSCSLFKVLSYAMGSDLSSSKLRPNETVAILAWHRLWVD